MSIYLINEIDVDVGQPQLQPTQQTTQEEPSHLSSEVRSKLIKANIYIKTIYQGGYEFGSGVIIHEDETYYYALTNYHVIDGNQHLINGYEVMSHDQVTSSFDVVAFEASIDLSLIRFIKENRDNSIIPLTISENININDFVSSIGNPSGSFGTITHGFILDETELRELELTHQVYEHNATLLNGSSGGALVNAHGELIGINTWTLNGYFYAIKSSVINLFLINKI